VYFFFFLERLHSLSFGLERRERTSTVASERHRHTLKDAEEGRRVEGKRLLSFSLSLFFFFLPIVLVFMGEVRAKIRGAAKSSSSSHARGTAAAEAPGQPGGPIIPLSFFLNIFIIKKKKK
jgi:hypothetical protein